MSTTVFCLVMLLPQATAAEVDDLIRQLDADKFAERRAAAQRLTEMGVEAFDQLVKSAQSPSAEVQSRSLDILENHFRNGEATTREAAKTALENLAKSETQAGRKARELLNPTPPAINLAQQRQIQLIAPQIAKAQAIQIQIAQRAANVQRTIRFSDGAKSVKIEINNQQIKMEITEKKDGKSVTKKIEAKDEADLKKNHPDAYKLFQRHAGARRPARAQIQLRGARPLPVAPQAKQRILEALKQSEAKLKEAVEEAKKSLEGEELKRALESLERRQKSLDETRKRYGGGEQEAKAS